MKLQLGQINNKPKGRWNGSNKLSIDGGGHRGTQFRHRLRKQVIEFLGGVCKKCGYDDPRAMQVDHIYGNGTQHRKQFSNNTAFHQDVLKDKIGIYQLLCANCNQIKRYENNEFNRNGGKSPRVGGKILNMREYKRQYHQLRIRGTPMDDRIYTKDIMKGASSRQLALF